MVFDATPSFDGGLKHLLDRSMAVFGYKFVRFVAPRGKAIRVYHFCFRVQKPLQLVKIGLLQVILDTGTGMSLQLGRQPGLARSVHEADVAATHIVNDLPASSFPQHLCCDSSSRNWT
eukprot:scaffold1036_cov343-Prasinococcus_capsulatus_cf.AAC.6